MQKKMDRFTTKVLNFIQKNAMVTEGMGIIAGFSGGADSTALLSVLWDLKDVLKISVTAIHINHCIRDEADEDEVFCRRYCTEKGIPFRAVKRDIPKMSMDLGITEEEAGRIARYEVFNECLKESGSCRIAVAHHANDVAETLLLNLTRGSGLKGLGGIRPVRDNVIRPLLAVTRPEIEEYLRERGISFCTDKTNLENDHTRNYLRNEIIPRLSEAVNSRAAEHLAKAAFSFDKAQEFIRSYSLEVFEEKAQVSENSVTVPVEALLSQKQIIRENLILLMFEKLVPGRKDISSAHVEAALYLLKDTNGEAFVSLPYGLKMTRRYDELELAFDGHRIEEREEFIPRIAPGEETEVQVPGLGRVIFRVFARDKDKQVPTETYTKWLDYGRIQEVLIRTRRPGDVIEIDHEGGIVKKSLNKFMTDSRIPASLRDDMYIIADGHCALWVPGYRISAGHKVSEQTQTILEINIVNGGNCNG